MNYSLTTQQRLKYIACETARMSYPGSMSRGTKQVVKQGAKRIIEDYFVNTFPLETLWTDVDRVACNYDAWHKEQTQVLGRLLLRQDCLGNPENNSLAVGAKFINTFMHQLMKYERFRTLWPNLHLPLDARIFQAFAKTDSSPTITRIRERIGAKSAYAISYDDYKFIQDALLDFIVELNHRPGMEFTIESRIELNFLWL